MKRSLDLVLNAATAAAFVLGVEGLARRSRQLNRSERRAASRHARLRVRRQADANRVIFAVEGTLDEFAARLLACSVAQVPVSTTAVIDLSEATPICGDALAVFAGMFAPGRRVRLRGLGEDHYGLLALPALAA